MRVSLTGCLFVCISVCLFVCMSVCLCVCLSVCLYVCLSVFLLVYASVFLCVCLIIYLCVSECASFFGVLRTVCPCLIQKLTSLKTDIHLGACAGPPTNFYMVRLYYIGGRYIYMKVLCSKICHSYLLFVHYIMRAYCFEMSVRNCAIIILMV